MLVGCGAGGAIAAAFGAPLTGAFYAFELIIGAYSLANAIPVFAATLAATLTTQAIIGAPYDITAPTVAPLTFIDYVALIGLGLVAAALGVGAMRVAALIERAFRAAIPWRLLRPVVGGLIVGSMALYTPQVLGAGHGALGLDFYWPLTATRVGDPIVLKLFACLVSLASGFRGGLFFASLFVGSLLGKLYAIGVDALAPSMGLETTACVLVGMGALERRDRRRPADHDLSGAREHRQSRRRRRRARRLDRDHARGARDLRLFVHHLAPASARRDHPRRPGRRLAARSDGWAHDGRPRRRSSPPTVGPRVPRSLSARQRQCRRRDRRGRALSRADPRRRGARAPARERRRRRPGRRHRSVCRRRCCIRTRTSAVALDVFGAAQADTLAVTARGTEQVLGTLGEAYAARRYAQETNLAMKGVLGGG